MQAQALMLLSFAHSGERRPEPRAGRLRRRQRLSVLKAARVRHLLRDVRPASALTYVEAAYLNRIDIERATAAHPASANIIRQAALKIAMRRAITLIAAAITLREKLSWSRAAKLAKGQGTDAPDAPHPAEEDVVMKQLKQVRARTEGGRTDESSPACVAA